MDQVVRLKHLYHFFPDSDNLSHTYQQISVRCKLVCILSGIFIDLKFSLQHFSGPWICKTGMWRVRQDKSSIFITTYHFSPGLSDIQTMNHKPCIIESERNGFVPCLHFLLISFMFLQILIHTIMPQASLVAQLVKHLPAKQETWVQSLGWEDSLEKGKATYSSILA